MTNKPAARAAYDTAMKIMEYAPICPVNTERFIHIYLEALLDSPEMVQHVENAIRKLGEKTIPIRTRDNGIEMISETFDITDIAKAALTAIIERVR